jgi:hypothetical protein
MFNAQNQFRPNLNLKILKIVTFNIYGIYALCKGYYYSRITGITISFPQA